MIVGTIMVLMEFAQIPHRLLALVGLAMLTSQVFSQGHQEEEEAPQPALVVAPMHNNILYRGIDNPLDVAVPGVPCGALTVNFSHGVAEGAGCRYIVNVHGDREPVLRVTVSWDHGGRRSEAESIFLVRDIPLPVACFASSCTDLDTIDVAHLRAAQGVVARLMDFGFDYKLTVVHYRLQVLRECTCVFDGRSSEARLTLEMSAGIKEVVGNDQVVISEIQVKDPSGVVRTIAPLRLVAR